MSSGIDNKTKDENPIIHNVRRDIMDIRSTISNSFLIAFAILVIPTLFASLQRITTIGWQPVMAVHIFLASMLWLFAIFRTKIPYQYRAGLLILVFLVIGTGGLIQFGLITGGLVFVICAAPLAALLFGATAAAYTLAVSIFSIAAVGFATVSGYIKPDFNFDVYHSAASSWVTVVFGSFLVAASLTTSISVFNKKLINSIKTAKLKELELKQHQQDLENIIEEKTRALKLSNEELERFAQIAAHDINSPLTNISGHAQLVKVLYKEKLDKKSNSSLDQIIESVNYVSSIIRDQLNRSKLNKQELVLGQIDMNEAFDTARKHLEADISDIPVTFSSDDLPTIKADKTQIIRVFQNLISNCIKYRDKSHDLTIQLSCVDENEHWQFCLTDNGIGIDAEQKNKVFDLYHQADNDYNTGNGIGLSSCKNIIEGHGGKIWIESTPGESCTVCFTLKKS